MSKTRVLVGVWYLWRDGKERELTSHVWIGVLDQIDQSHKPDDTGSEGQVSQNESLFALYRSSSAASLQGAQRKYPHQRNFLQGAQFQLPDGAPRQSENDKIGENIRSGAGDEEDWSIDTRALDTLVPNELNRSALESQHEHNHNAPTNGEDTKRIGRELDISPSSKDADIQQENGDFDNGDRSRPDELRGKKGLNSKRDQKMNSHGRGKNPPRKKKLLLVPPWQPVPQSTFLYVCQDHNEPLHQYVKGKKPWKPSNMVAPHR